MRVDRPPPRDERFNGAVPSLRDPVAAPFALVPWPVLHPTTQAAYNQILWNRGLAKAEVARQIGVSRTRMTVVGRELETAGLIVAGGKEARATRGRPGDTLVAVPDAFHFMGVHVRGQRLQAVVTDMENVVVWEDSGSVDSLDAAALFDRCNRWLSAASAAGFAVTAVAFCGSFQQLDDTAPGVDLRAIVGEHVLSRFAEQLGGSVWVEDDMVALTAFEQWPRLADGQDSMALISLGTQIGFGVVVDRRIVVGAHRMAGRFAHVPVAPDGPPCQLGHRGCLWGVASVSSILARIPGASTLEEAATVAQTDASAADVLAAAARGLGAAVGQIANLIDPDKVVLAGEAGRLLAGREEEFRAGVSAVQLGADPVIETTDFGYVEWARAAGSLAMYRTLGGDRI